MKSFVSFEVCIKKKKLATYILHWMGDNTKDDDFLNGSSAMGRTRTIAFAKIYIIPKEPHTEPKIVIGLVKGYSSSEALLFPNEDVHDNDVFDSVVELTPLPLLYGFVL